MKQKPTEQLGCETWPICAFCKKLYPIMYNLANGKHACVPCMREQCEINLRKRTPEGCVLEAADTGDGWSLEVRASDGPLVAILAWPETWPVNVTRDKLIRSGFEVT